MGSKVLGYGKIYINKNAFHKETNSINIDKTSTIDWIY